ncbi:MAG: hypothetical protein KDN05_19985 [Verrucomicrobiae bacterium]|nr:hypothetical protein [Verrucomicrobiae bacterium]
MTRHLRLLLPLAALLPLPSHAATIVAGDVTATIGPDFFFDSASTGGGTDFNSANVNFLRDFGTLNVGTGGTEITIGGVGWATSGTTTAVPATSATITITYLGQDEAVGGGDDVLIGTVTDAFSYNGTASEMVWDFDSPLSATIDGLGSVFLMNVNSNGNIRYKTFPNASGIAANVKLSIAGTSVAVPEPTAAMLGGLGFLALLRRRRA